MWPFTKHQRHESCRSKLAELDDRCQVIEGRLQNLALDLSDRYEKLYDRLARVYARLTKRETRDGPEPPSTPDQDPKEPRSRLPEGREVPRSAHLARRFRVGG